MAHPNWLGTAAPTAQVAYAEISAYDAATIYSINIGGIGVTTVGAGSIAATADNLAAAFNASTHPYFTCVTAVSDEVERITLTADNAGFPYIWTIAATGGSGTVTGISTITGSTGPHHWDEDDNFDTGAVPAASDTVELANNNIGIFFGLDSNSSALDKYLQKLSYTGQVGLNSNAFMVSEGVENSTVSEYRPTYLEVDATSIRIGQKDLESVVIGSTRTKIQNTKAGASTTHVHESAQTASEAGLPAIRLLFGNAGNDLQIHGARAGIGIGVDPAGVTMTMGDIHIGAEATGVNVSVGDGVTFDNWEQYNGTHTIGAGTLNTKCTVHSGVLTTDEDITLPSYEMNGGTAVVNGVITAGVLNAGHTDASQNESARTWATITQEKGAQLTASAFGAGGLTITTHNLPGERATLSVT